MICMIARNAQFDVLARLLDVAALRHDVIAQNVANINTPGYRGLEVRFEDAFAQALAAGDARQALTVRPEVAAAAGGAERFDGNNVDIDAEMGRLGKNSVLFKVYTQLLSVQLAQYRSAISGR
jgi:flagellar basal-body rod protein FlgB